MCAASNGEDRQEVARLRCAALVAVVQAADLWNGDHTSRSQRCDRTWKGCILVQPEMPSCSRVIGDVLLQHAAKASGCQYDDVIEAFTPDRSDESFDVGVLPWGARRRQDFLNADGIHLSERMIAIAEEVSRHLVPGECVAKLLHGPSGGGMLRDGDMNDAPAIMSEKHQDKQQPARHRRHHEEVGGDQLLRLVGQERTPRLRGEGVIRKYSIRSEIYLGIRRPFLCQDPIGAHLCEDLPQGRCPFLALSVQQRAANGSKRRHQAKVEIGGFYA